MSIYIFVQFVKEIKFIFLTKTIIKRERERKKNPIGIAFTKEINVYKSIFI